MPLDSTPVLSILDRVTDSDGNPVSGAILYFYEAGTSTPKTVYSDANLSVSLGTSVTCDSGGFPTSDGSTKCQVYTGTASYKVTVKTSAGVTLWSIDNIKGAVDLPADTSTALPITPVVSRTTTYTVLTSDRGKLINCDPTGGSFAVTLLAATSAGDNFRVGIRHGGDSTNVVTVRTSGAESISGAAPIFYAQTLTGLGHTRWFVCDGAGWSVDSEVPPLMSGPLPFFHVTDRATSAPSSPSGGQRFIINGTPTGTWATLGFDENDVVESDGNGSWIEYNPRDGWLAYVGDENLLVQYRDTAWVDLSNVTAAATGYLGYAVFEHQVADGSGGGTSTAGSFQVRTLNTTVVNTITGASLAANAITLPVGRYLVMAEQSIYTEMSGSGGLNSRQQKFASLTATVDNTFVGLNNRQASSASTFSVSHGNTIADTWLINVSVAGTCALNYYTDQAFATYGLGYPSALNNPEVYARVSIISLASPQGPIGPTGPQGADGLDAAHPYQWSTLTTGDPGSGKIRGNNATIASITEIAISETSSDGGGMGAVLASWDVSTSSVKGTVRVAKEGATSNFYQFRITGAGTDNGTYRTYPVQVVQESGTLGNGNAVSCLFVEKGDLGDPGTSVPDISALTEDTANDDEADWLIEYDVSSSSQKKLKAKNLGYTRSGGTRRGLQSKLGDLIDFRDFSSVSDGTTDLRVALQAAIDACGIGHTLRLPRYPIAVGPHPSGGYCVSRATPIRIVCEQGGGIKPLSTVTTSDHIVYLTGSAHDVYAATKIEGLFVGDNGAATRYGGHAVVLDTQAAGATFARFQMSDNCYLQQATTTGFAGLYHINNTTNNVNGGLYACSIRNNVIAGISLNGSGDSIWIGENTLIGEQEGVYANLVADAGNLVIYRNNASARKGCVVIDRAVTWDIINNEFEQVAANTESNNAMVDLRGTTATLGPGNVIGNMMQDSGGTGDGDPYIVRVGAASGAAIRGNRIATSSVRVGVLITASASNTVWGKNTLVDATLSDSGVDTIYEPESKGTATSLVGNSTGSKAAPHDIAIGTGLVIAAGPTLTISGVNVPGGGTGNTSATAYAPIFGGTTSTGPFQSAAGLGTAGQPLVSNGAGALASFQTAPATGGGTGQSSYAVGDILYASTTTALSKLADVATGNALISGGVGVAPSYGKIGLTTHISGTLAVDNGGSGRTSHTAYAVICGGTTSTGAQQSIASVGTSGHVLTSNGASALPTFQAPKHYLFGKSSPSAAGSTVTYIMNAADVTESLVAFRTPVAATWTKISIVTLGAPAAGSWVFTLRHTTTTDTALTCTISAGSNSASGTASVSISADTWISIKCDATGSATAPGLIAWALEYTVP